VPLRSQGIPLVPNGVDAFLFLDREHIFSGESSHKQKRRPRPVLRGASVTEAVAAWQHAGWQIRPIAMVERSPFVGAARLTTKTLKFAVGASFAELLDDRDWVVAVDYNMYIDLSKLASFLGQYEGQAPLLLLDWRHWPGNYSLSGTECLLREMRTMLFKWKVGGASCAPTTLGCSPQPSQRDVRIPSVASTLGRHSANRHSAEQTSSRTPTPPFSLSLARAHAQARARTKAYPFSSLRSHVRADDQGYIKGSRRNCESWMRKMQREHDVWPRFQVGARALSLARARLRGFAG